MSLDAPTLPGFALAELAVPSTEAGALAVRRLPLLSLLTTSSARKWHTCARLYLHAVEQGYHPLARAEALSFGSLVHLGLEAWWRAAWAWQLAGGGPGSPPDALDHALAAMQGEADEYVYARAWAMLTAYHHRWADMIWDGHPIEVLGVEVQFTAPLLNPTTGAASRTFQRAGKIDLIIRVGGRVYIAEHKSSGEDITAGSSYWARLSIDAQISNYHVGARALGHDVQGCIYDVLGKPTLKPHKATPLESRKWTKPTKTDPTSRLYAGQREVDETPGDYAARLLDAIAAAPADYLARAEIVRLEAEETSAAADVWYTASQIREARLTGEWPRNRDACFGYGSRCGFFDVCAGVARLEDASRFRQGESHEELSPAVEPEAADVAE